VVVGVGQSERDKTSSASAGTEVDLVTRLSLKSGTADEYGNSIKPHVLTHFDQQNEKRNSIIRGR